MMLLRLLPPVVVLGAALFLLAGRLDVWPLWAWLGALYASAGATFTLLSRKSPGLLAERLKPPSDRDRATRRLVAPFFLGHLVFAGLDARAGWSQLPAAVTVAALVVFTLAFALVGWTLLSNPWASSAVRLQPERGHAVVSHGPYRWVRHPMYLAVVLSSLTSGLALGSWAAAPWLLPVIAIFVRRTLLEDRMLQQELAGYSEYAGRVRWRVVPGLF